jgi:uncharacterized protein RhaS with RHS repeats
MNLYAYVRGDPVNYVDPSGLLACTGSVSARAVIIDGDVYQEVTVSACAGGGGGGGGFYGGSIWGSGGYNFQTQPRDGGSLGSQAPQSDLPGDIVVNCNAVCRANLEELERVKYLLVNGRYQLNPNYIDPYPWLNLQNAITIPPLIGATAATAPLVPGFLGPSGPAFGDTAFGATSQGFFNSGFYRMGFGRGLGQANFRVGIGSSKWDIFFISIPK